MGIKQPYYVKIILIIILDIWLLWSHHGVLYNTARNKLEVPNPFDFRICTLGQQWPCKYIDKELKNIHKNNSLLTHGEIFITFDYKSIYDLIICSGVCQMGRIGVWCTIIATNIIYLTPQKIRHNANSLNAMKIIGWIIIGLNMGLSLILNWPLFIRSIPAYVILILLQLDLYSENDEPTKNSPSTTPTTSAIPTPTL